MATTRMKSETREEARDRLIAMSEAERRGAAAATEGQVVAERRSPGADDDVVADLMDSHQEARLAPAVSDYRTEAVIAPVRTERPARRAAKKGKSGGENA